MPHSLFAGLTYHLSRFTYLGIKISSNLKDLYNLNYTPLIQAVRRDLDRWCSLPLSLLGRIHLIKMNILPRLLYLFQVLPLVLSKKVLSKLNGFIMSFIWNKTAQVKISLSLSSCAYGWTCRPIATTIPVVCSV